MVLQRVRTSTSSPGQTERQRQQHLLLHTSRISRKSRELVSWFVFPVVLTSLANNNERMFRELDEEGQWHFKGHKSSVSHHVMTTLPPHPMFVLISSRAHPANTTRILFIIIIYLFFFFQNNQKEWRFIKRWIFVFLFPDLKDCRMFWLFSTGKRKRNCGLFRCCRILPFSSDCDVKPVERKRKRKSPDHSQLGCRRNYHRAVRETVTITDAI